MILFIPQLFFLLCRIIYGWLIRRKLQKRYHQNLLKKLVYEAKDFYEERERRKEIFLQAKLIHESRMAELLLQLKSHHFFDEKISKERQKIEQSEFSDLVQDSQKINLDGLLDDSAQSKDDDGSSIRQAEKQQKKLSQTKQGSERGMKGVNSTDQVSLASLPPIASEKKIEKVEITFEEYLQSLSPYRPPEKETNVVPPDYHYPEVGEVKSNKNEVKDKFFRDEVDNYQVVDFIQRYSTYDAVLVHHLEEEIPVDVKQTQDKNISQTRSNETAFPIPSMPNPRFSRPEIGKITPTPSNSSLLQMNQPFQTIAQPSAIEVGRRESLRDSFEDLHKIKTLYSDDDQVIILNRTEEFNKGRKKPRPKSADARSSFSQPLTAMNNLPNVTLSAKEVERTEIPLGKKGYDEFFSNLFGQESPLLPESPQYVAHPSYQFAQNLYYQRQKRQQEAPSNIELYGHHFAYVNGGTGPTTSKTTSNHNNSSVRPKSAATSRGTSNKSNKKNNNEKKKSSSSSSSSSNYSTYHQQLQQQKKQNILSSYLS